MLKPHGRKIGVTELSTDWSSADLGFEHVDNSAISNDDVIPQNVQAENLPDTETDTDENTMIDLLEEVAEDGKNMMHK